MRIALPPATGRISTTIVTTVSSDGKIRIYDMYSIPVITDKVTEIGPVAEYDTNGTRLTCVTIADGDVSLGKSSNGKRKHEDDDLSDIDEFGGINSDDGGEKEGGEENEVEGEEED